MTEASLALRYWRGLLVADRQPDGASSWFTFDQRTNQWVAPAESYRSFIEWTKEVGIAVTDDAKAYTEVAASFKTTISPRSDQQDALHAWLTAKGRGVVSLPTGAGKTVLAIMAIAKVKRSTLIVVPTIDLVEQWYASIEHWLGYQSGRLGGGRKEVRPITVSTYDSALIHLDKIGNQFGFLVVDECHHLAGPQNQLIARGMIAPYRLGLSATIERSDGGEALIYELMGEQVYTADIRSLVGGTLAPYDVKRIMVELTEAERAEYELVRSEYLNFIRRFRIDIGRPGGWQEFLAKGSRLPGGRAAIKGHRRQKEIAQKASAKLAALWEIVKSHIEERIIVFTDNNDHAYTIGEQLAAPVLTHLTKPVERAKILDCFRNGTLPLLVTSKVLNEGVDVPEASVAVVASGSGTVREHVQRLGRILRGRPGKRAVLYEVLADGTSEISVNQRRREHRAYQEHVTVST